MGLISEFLEWIEGEPPEVKGDPGGESTHAADYYQPSGDDSQPLPSDFYFMEQGVGRGTYVALAWLDPIAENFKAEPGEKRIYARDSDGNAVCEIHLKASGEIFVTSIGGQIINVNGMEVDKDGNVSIPGSLTVAGDSKTKGEVVAMDGGASVSLSTHLHNTAMGPSDKPTPGT